MKTVVVAATTEPHRQAEALRAALGLTLRGADVVAVTVSPPSRTTETLTAFGHRVVDAIDLAADAVEVWTGERPIEFPIVRDARRILHLVRPGAEPRGVADGDRVVYLAQTPEDDVVALAFAYELVVTW